MKHEASELKLQLEKVEEIAEAHAIGEPVTNPEDQSKLDAHVQLVKVCESTYKMIMDAIKAEA